MATIFTKITGATPDQCLILSPREAIVYPFDVGLWSELRCSYYVSFCGTTSGNQVYAAEAFPPAGTNYKNGGHWGLKDSGNFFPTQTGSIFCGITPVNAAGNSNLLDTNLVLQNLGNITPTFITNGTLVTGNLSPFSNCNITLQSIANSVGTTNYAGFMSQKFVLGLTPSGKRTISFSQASNSTDSAPYSVAALRARTQVASYTVGVTGYLTSNFTPTGTNLDVPNSVFIYVPFLNNRLRIHNILVEKYS